MKWASWINVVIGIWLVISPWIFTYGSGTAVAEDVILGLAVIVVGLWSVSVASAETGPAAVNVVLAIWIVIAPWVLGYSVIAPSAMQNDVITGIVIGILALIRIGTARRLPAGAPGDRI